MLDLKVVFIKIIFALTEKGEKKMRLIDADELRRKWKYALYREPEAKGTVVYRSFEFFIEILDYEPTIEAEPVRHGRWQWITEDIYRCTNCGEKNHVKEVMGQPDFNYCPLCGAKMDKEEE